MSTAGLGLKPALKHHYAPRGTCRELFTIRDAEVLVSGPAGTGKSRACLEKLHFAALANPGMAGLIVRKTLASLGGTALKTWRTYVAAESIAVGHVWFYGGSAQDPPQYQYSNGSTITIGGIDKPSKIMSSEYDMIYVQEATELHEADWEACATRLRNGRISFQQLIADCNPDKPTHWLKARADRGQTKMLESRHEDNPVLFDSCGVVTERGKAYISKLDSLTGVRYLRLRKGLWAASEGLVYEYYDPAVHLIDHFKVPADWTRWWTIDFGYRNPFVLQCWAEDNDGRLYLYREIYMTGRTVDEHAAKILSIVMPDGASWCEPKPRAIIVDHDAEDRATFEKHVGMSTSPARKTVSDGIQVTDMRFRDRRIFLMRDSLVERDPTLVEANKPCCTVEEVVGYVWDTGGGKKVKEQPLKEDDHGCDGMRYMVAERDLGGRPNVRFM